jgi:hypothetical protein
VKRLKLVAAVGAVCVLASACVNIPGVTSKIPTPSAAEQSANCKTLTDILANPNSPASQKDAARKAARAQNCPGA